MAGYAKSESGVRKDYFYKRFEFWLGALALLVAVYAAFTARDAADQAEESNRVANEVFEWQKAESLKAGETRVELDARVYWDSVYLGPFKMEPSNPYPRPEEVWPRGGGFYYGFEVYVAVSLYNDSEQPVSVTRISCSHSVNQMSTGGGPFAYKYCFGADLVTPVEFPLYLAPKKQVQTYVKIDWPVIEEVVDIFTGIPNKHYDHQQIMELYNSRAPRRFGCSGDESCLGALFIQRFCSALPDGSSSKHRVLVVAHLAKGEQYHKILEF